MDEDCAKRQLERFPGELERPSHVASVVQLVGHGAIAPRGADAALLATRGADATPLAGRRNILARPLGHWLPYSHTNEGDQTKPGTFLTNH